MQKKLLQYQRHNIFEKWLPQTKVIEPYALQEEFEEMMKEYLVGN